MSFAFLDAYYFKGGVAHKGERGREGGSDRVNIFFFVGGGAG